MQGFDAECDLAYYLLLPEDLQDFHKRINKLSFTKALSLSVFYVGCQDVCYINGKMTMRGQAGPSATERSMDKS